jgi:putative transposase
MKALSLKSISTLDRNGLIQSMRRRRIRAQGRPLSSGQEANDLWCTDYKGEFQLKDRRYCYPLTVTDCSSHYLLLCEALESNRGELARKLFFLWLQWKAEMAPVCIDRVRT